MFTSKEALDYHVLLTINMFDYHVLLFYTRVHHKYQNCLPFSLRYAWFKFLFFSDSDMRQVIEEFGSFDKYIWNFVNHKPIVSQFRYPRQVPVKTPKAEFISKDLVKRGFRSVGPTIIYTFMQVAGLTNDHLISCFRFQECLATVAAEEEDASRKDSTLNTKLVVEDPTDLGLLARAIP